MADNLRIWSQVEKTDPTHTKHVAQRGGFTAISAAYQIKRATETFGPIGEGWGYDAGEPIFHDLMVFVPVTLWHGDRTNKFGPMFGGAEWKDGKGRIDSDAPKKATTDAITKLLSQLGFNADVFMGLFDDSKYVAALKAEAAEASREPERLRPQAAPAGQPSAAVQAASIAIDFCKTVAQLEKWAADNKGGLDLMSEGDRKAVRERYGKRLELLKQADNPFPAEAA